MEDNNNSKKETQLNMVSKFENPNNALYLHPSNKPRLVLISQFFIEENYSIWKHFMIILLSAKNKNVFIDRLMKQPSDISMINYNNGFNMTILSRHLKEIVVSVFYYDETQTVWNELHKCCSQLNNIQNFHIENEIHDCVQRITYVGSYFTRLKTLWDDRDILYPITKCSCWSINNKLFYWETLKTINFFIRLVESFDVIREQILMMCYLPKVSKVYSSMLRHELQHNVSAWKSMIHSKIVAFVIKDTNKQSENYKYGKCYKEGHSTKNE